MATAIFQGRATDGAGRMRAGRGFLPLPSGALHRHILQHAGAHGGPAPIQCIFHRAERGLGMLRAPFAHAGQNLGSQRVPPVVVGEVRHGHG